jgi:hypothetical protein
MTAGSGGGVLARTLNGGGGCPRVCVWCIEVAGLTLYHPHVASNGGVCVHSWMRRVSISR